MAFVTCQDEDRAGKREAVRSGSTREEMARLQEPRQHCEHHNQANDHKRYSQDFVLHAVNLLSPCCASILLAAVNERVMEPEEGTWSEREQRSIDHQQAA